MSPIRVGISACLAGQRVRYDGSHKYHPSIIAWLAGQFELLPFCPEVEIGLGVPRGTIELVETDGRLGCVDSLTGQQDFTAALTTCADQQASVQATLSGYVFKSRSPSCGTQGVPVTRSRQSSANGMGIFAARVQENFKRMPIIEEGPLANPRQRDRFIEEVLAYHRQQQIRSTR